MAMAEEAQDLREVAAQASIYPFLAAVRPWIEQAEALAKKEDGYLLKQLSTYKDTWLDIAEDLLTPLKEFLKGNQKTVYDQVKAFEIRFGDEFADLSADLVATLESLLKSDKPYAGGLIPQANNAMAELQKQLEQRLQQTKAEALQQINEQEARLKTDADFQKLDAEQQGQVLVASVQARADVQSANKPSTAMLRVNRYRNEEVPKQVKLMADLATPTIEKITVVAASALKVGCPLSQITNTGELQQWLDCLRASAQAVLDQGHRISL
jgi:hypothetical protein